MVLTWWTTRPDRTCGGYLHGELPGQTEHVEGTYVVTQWARWYVEGWPTKIGHMQGTYVVTQWARLKMWRICMWWPNRPDWKWGWYLRCELLGQTEHAEGTYVVDYQARLNMWRVLTWWSTGPHWTCGGYLHGELLGHTEHEEGTYMVNY